MTGARSANPYPRIYSSVARLFPGEQVAEELVAHSRHGLRSAPSRRARAALVGAAGGRRQRRAVAAARSRRGTGLGGKSFGEVGRRPLHAGADRGGRSARSAAAGYDLDAAAPRCRPERAHRCGDQACADAGAPGRCRVRRSLGALAAGRFLAGRHRAAQDQGTRAAADRRHAGRGACCRSRAHRRRLRLPAQQCRLVGQPSALVPGARGRAGGRGAGHRLPRAARWAAPCRDCGDRASAPRRAGTVPADARRADRLRAHGAGRVRVWRRPAARSGRGTARRPGALADARRFRSERRAGGVERGAGQARAEGAGHSRQRPVRRCRDLAAFLRRDGGRERACGCRHAQFELPCVSAGGGWSSAAGERRALRVVHRSGQRRGARSGPAFGAGTLGDEALRG